MIIAVDVGNTNIVIGGFLENKLSFVVRIATNISQTEDEYAAIIKGILKSHDADERNVKGAIISSVVPPLTDVLKRAFNIAYGISAIDVAPGIKTGINLKCDNPATVGADLICACVATYQIYGGPALIIDMGTATKIMVIDENGAFFGASIIPGVNISLKALSSGTAQLPQINLEAPKSVIGKNTIDCMKSGIVFGNSAMLDGLIERYFDEIGSDVPVYATGGLSRFIIPHCKHKITINENLVLSGLYIIYNKNI